MGLGNDGLGIWAILSCSKVNGVLPHICVCVCIMFIYIVSVATQVRCPAHFMCDHGGLCLHSPVLLWDF